MAKMQGNSFVESEIEWNAFRETAWLLIRPIFFLPIGDRIYNRGNGSTVNLIRGTQRGYSSKPLNIALLNVF